MERADGGARGSTAAGVVAVAKQTTPRRARAIVLFVVVLMVIACFAAAGIGQMGAYVGTPRHDDDVSLTGWKGDGGEVMDRTPGEPYLEEGTVIQLKERKMGSPAEEEGKDGEEQVQEQEEEDVGGEGKANTDTTEDATEDTTTTTTTTTTSSEKLEGASVDESPPPFLAGLSDEEKVRFAPFAGDAGIKLDRWGIGGPTKGGIINETGTAGYAPYVHRPQTRIVKKGLWVTLERMLGDSGETVAKGKKGGGVYPSLRPSFANHEAYYKSKGCFGTCAERGVMSDVPAVNLKGVTCKDMPELVPYNFVPTAHEDLKIMKKMLACGIPFAYVRWTDGAGHVLRGSVRMGTVLRGRMDAEMKAKVQAKTANGWLTGAPLDQLVRDTWLALNVSHPRYMLAMPIPTCLEGMHDERMTGGTAALRWLDFYITGNEKTSAKNELTKSSPSEFFEGKFMPSLARWSYSSLFTHQLGAEALPVLRALAKRKGTVVIASEGVKMKAEKLKLGWDVYAMPPELYLDWEGEMRAKHIEKMTTMAKESKGRVFLCSFSAVCAIFFHRMWEVSQDNWYIVVGTALDALLGDKTRSWIDNKCTKLAKECTMYRSTYHWGTWNGFNGGIIPHAAGSWTRKTGCKARQPFSVQYVVPRPNVEKVLPLPVAASPG